MKRLWIKLKRKTSDIWNELDSFYDVNPNSGVMGFMDHLTAVKGEKIRNYNVLYPYVMIAYYFRKHRKERKKTNE